MLLKFADPERERAFTERYVWRCLRLSQWWLTVAGLLYYMFFIYDRIIQPSTAGTTQLIRAAVTLTIWGGVGLTVLPISRRLIEPIFLTVGGVAAVGVCAIAAIQRSGYYQGTSGIVLLVVGLATLLFIRLRLFIFFLLFSAGCFFFTEAVVEHVSPQMQFANSYFIAGGLIIGFATCYHREQAARGEFQLEQELSEERAKSEDLLYNVLPESVVGRLKQGRAVADSYGDVAVIFVDLVGSSQLARQLSPGHLVEVLGLVFSLGDRCAAQHGVEKVKTIGDAYLAVAGAAMPADRSAAIRFARDYLEGVRELASKQGLPLQLRIGIHSGPVIGGVIGETRMVYDYWGDTMNVAARVEGVAQPGGFSVTEPTYFATRHVQTYGSPRLLELKGVGQTKIYDAVL